MLLRGMSVDSGSGEDLAVSVNACMCTVFLCAIFDLVEGRPTNL